MKLYELGHNYKILNEFIENALSSDEMTEEDIQVYIDTLESIEDLFENKVENIVKFLKNIKSDIDALKAEEDRLSKKRKYLENKYNGLKNYIQNVFEINEIQKIKAGLFNVRLQKSPPSLEILDIDKIPAEFKIPQPEKIKNKEILDAIKLGMKVNCVRIIDGKKHIRFS